MYPNRYRAGDPEYGPSEKPKSGSVLPAFDGLPSIIRLPIKLIVFIIAIPVGMAAMMAIGVGSSLFFLMNDIFELFAGIYNILSMVIRKIIGLTRKAVNSPGS